MAEPILRFHGAGRTVTGACFEVAHGKRRLLVDCGLFQGSRSLERLNYRPFPFDAGRIDALILTHAHIDHSGLLPRLAAEGFTGPVWCTPPTRDLLAEMLPDSARIQELEAERRNRRADRADEPPIEPLYTGADADAAVGLVRTVELEEVFHPTEGYEARLWNAGHRLGSASAELRVGGVHLLFSGDLGPEHKSFHLDPRGPHGLDHVVCEATYGDRDREEATAEQRRAQLAAEVERALAGGGNLVVPVFALERTQELLLDLATLIDERRIREARVFIDSPLASRVTKIFVRHAGRLEDVGKRDVFTHAAFHFVEDAGASMRLNSVSGAIILAASGMCEAGRIRHHLRHNLARRDSTILFVGFQAQGTLGRAILDGARRVRISGRDVAVRAAIRRIDSYSAHADRRELAEWAKARRPVGGTLFLVHGEPAALESLQDELSAEFGSIRIPEIGERYALASAAPARRTATGRVELREAIGCDWQNDYADLTANLKNELRRMEDDARRRDALASMREILRGLRATEAKRTARR